MLRQFARRVLPDIVRRPLARSVMWFERRREAAALARERAAQAARAIDEEAARIERRRKAAFAYYNGAIERIEEWARQDTEDANFYYDLQDRSKTYLAHFVAIVTGAPFGDAARWIAELENDAALMAHLKATLVDAYPQKDIRPAYGRRLGWYAIARATRPRIVVETGVDHGVGACVLCAALLRNAGEGSPGRYFGLDILPSAGRLLTGEYATVGQMVYGDSIASLEQFQHTIDMFVNDSDHAEDFESREYRALAPHLAATSVVLSDNSHATDALARFSAQAGRRFLYFHEVPKDHWYPGAGIGASF